MKLIDKPHCTKHEVYTQGCIGCRIKDSRGVSIYSTDDGDKVVPHGHDMANKHSDTKSRPVKSAQITELKKLLKAIRNSGAEDTPRSLQADIETITRLFS